MGVLNFSSKRGQNEIHSDFAEREKIQGLKNLNVPNSRNAPRLRFPEFSEDWSATQIGKVLKIGNGKDYKLLKEGSIPVFGTGGYMLSVDDYLYDG